MAATLTNSELRDALRRDESVAARAFDILKAISNAVNADADSDFAREMVLRALSRRDEFGGHPDQPQHQGRDHREVGAEREP